MPNQHKPLPPEDDIKESFKFYYGLGINDKKIALHMRDHYDTERYGLSVRSVKRLRDKWELKSTRQQKHTLESIGEAIQDIRRQYPSRGADMIRRDLLVKLNMRVPRPLIQRYLHETEPHAVQARKQRRFKRRRFYAAGVNDVWAQDQHDKWGPRFGLWLHNNIDPFIGFNNWLKVWWTNKNPRLIARYFLNTVREFGAIPVTTQSDPGSENYGVANVQTVIRQTLDPSLKGTLQHRWMRKKNNVKSEANWSVFRRDFTPGYEDLFESGVVAGYYDVDNPLENLVFRWLAIPWIQSELDKWVLVRNRTAPRADTKKVLPHGIPELMRVKPELYDAMDFKIPVPLNLIDELEQVYAPPDHPVFQLTPPEFHEHASAFYARMGSPVVTFDTFWNVYCQMLQSFQVEVANTNPKQPLTSIVSSHFNRMEQIENEPLPLLPGMKDYRMGGIEQNGEGADAEEMYASFTEESSESDVPDLEEEDG